MTRRLRAVRARYTAVLLLWSSLCAMHLCAALPSVKEMGGNIVLVQPDGTIKRLTAMGTDSMPSLSPDGSKVVFVRSPKLSGSDELCLIDLTRPLHEQPVTLMSPDLSRQGQEVRVLDPQFSPDSSTVYFYTQPGNLGLVISVDPTRGHLQLPWIHQSGASQKHEFRAARDLDYHP